MVTTRLSSYLDKSPKRVPVATGGSGHSDAQDLHVRDPPYDGRSLAEQVNNHTRGFNRDRRKSHDSPAAQHRHRHVSARRVSPKQVEPNQTAPKTEAFSIAPRSNRQSTGSAISPSTAMRLRSSRLSNHPTAQLKPMSSNRNLRSRSGRVRNPEAQDNEDDDRGNVVVNGDATLSDSDDEYIQASSPPNSSSLSWIIERNLVENDSPGVISPHWSNHKPTISPYSPFRPQPTHDENEPDEGEGEEDGGEVIGRSEEAEAEAQALEVEGEEEDIVDDNDAQVVQAESMGVNERRNIRESIREAIEAEEEPTPRPHNRRRPPSRRARTAESPSPRPSARPPNNQPDPKHEVPTIHVDRPGPAPLFSIPNDYFETKKVNDILTVKHALTVLLAFILLWLTILNPSNFESIIKFIRHHLRFPHMGAYMPSSGLHNTSTYSGVSTEVDRRLSEITRDVVSLKDEWSRKLTVFREPAKPVIPAIDNPLSIPKVNFLSPGMGTTVDHELTSPTKEPSLNPVKQILQNFLLRSEANPPEIALQPWDGVGDAWCSHVFANGTQLALNLGRAILPEEVIVEHIPRSATLDGGSTPRHMELWVQYILQTPDSPSDVLSGMIISSSHSTKSGYKRHSRPPFEIPTSPSSAADTIFDLLQSTFPNASPSSFNDDPLLGPSFFRIATWEYDANDRSHIQSFPVDAVIKIPHVRAVKAIFRVRSTWGSPHVCLYRLRLHGRTET